MNQHIFLTGMPGSGKTTLGKASTDVLHLPFVDLDEYIQSKEKKTISEIFESEDEEVFRKKEKMYLKEVAEIKTPHLIALGGGTICNDENLQYVKHKGILIYLELSVNELAERLKCKKETRPLLKDISVEDMEKYISFLLKLRKKHYEQSHIKINALHLTASQLLNTILDFAQKNSN